MPKIELDKQSSLEDAMREFQILSDENKNLERQVKEFSELSSKLGHENEALRDQISKQEAFYRDQIETLTHCRDRLQRKCVALITRLSCIKDTIVAAEREAHDEAIKQAETDDKAADLKKQAERIAALPQNDQRIPAVNYQ